MCKMVVTITSKTWEKCHVETIEKGRCFCVNRRELKMESDVENWAQVFDKCDPKIQTRINT